MKRKNGFTLIKLIVVMAIISILAAAPTLIPALSRAREENQKARAAKARVDDVKEDELALFQLGFKVKIEMEDDDITAMIVGRKIVDNSTDTSTTGGLS
tara:strand:+ start:1310 stop:1606 length:297 start_codon:yes stop_codon:yes gene_type:complete